VSGLAGSLQPPQLVLDIGELTLDRVHASLDVVHQLVAVLERIDKLSLAAGNAAVVGDKLAVLAPGVDGAEALLEGEARVETSIC